MNNARVAVLLGSLAAFLCVACQEKYPTMDDLSVLTVEGTSVQFFREKPGTILNRVYMQALGQGVLTIQNNCLRLDEDGPVIIWPPGFIPNSNDGVIEVHDAMGQVVARVGEPLEIVGGYLQRDTGSCSGPTWADTRILTEKATQKTPSWPSPDDPPD